MTGFSMKILGIFCVLFLVTTGRKCAKILGVFHLAWKSHYMAGSLLMKILAEKGHDVTIVAGFKEKNPPKNYHQIYLDGLHEKTMAMAGNIFDFVPITALKPIGFDLMALYFQELVLNHTNFKKFMNTKQHFDAVIVEEFQAEAIKYIAHHFNAPLIVYNAIDANDWVNRFQGNPDSPSYQACYEMPGLTNHMSFFERLQNTIFYVYKKLIYNIFTFRKQNELLHKYYPDAPDLTDIAYNVSLVLVNSDPSVHEPIPKVPSIKDIGGFHITKPKPLPEDLQTILDNAKHGVIFFSLGSNVKSVDMPEKTRGIILNKFSKLKETVIWKFEDTDLPNKPVNVVIRKWFPQSDIFAHKNVKLFISHGGLFSTMEAIHYGLPVLVLSIFGDQRVNGIRAEANGFAKHLPFKEITEDNFSEILDELLTNPKYKENANIRSKILRDKPIDPAEAVNYWVEYVIRHKGAPHLRVASLDLKWYEYLLIDVTLFILTLAIGIVSSVIYLLKHFSKKKINMKKKKN